MHQSPDHHESRSVSILLTRPAERNQGLARRLLAEGCDVLDAPALRIDTVSGACPYPGPGDLFVFVSRHAVEAYFDQHAQWPAQAWAAAVGAATAQALRERVPASRVLAPGPGCAPDSEHLLEILLQRLPDPQQARILRAQQGRDWLATRLAAHGWTVSCHAVYRRVPVLWDATVTRRLAWGHPLVLLLTSLEALDAIDRSLAFHGVSWPGSGLAAVTLHERIVRRLQCRCEEAGAAPPIVQISAPDESSLFRAILAAAQSVWNPPSS
ncbi:uroporphyrinogen-III synthase [Castellaniella sp.]|uniref:uroporphyrinogen-III synthase n=1 Tax=Castellaniella sp. TaxID=1955812 RepID=UPI00355E527E